MTIKFNYCKSLLLFLVCRFWASLYFQPFPSWLSLGPFFLFVIKLHGMTGNLYVFSHLGHLATVDRRYSYIFQSMNDALGNGRYGSVRYVLNLLPIGKEMMHSYIMARKANSVKEHCADNKDYF